MKIGILTFHCAHNYGAVLQAYALQEQLKIMGHNVEIINYRPNYLIEPYKVLRKERFFSILSIKRPWIFIREFLNILFIRPKRFRQFEQFSESYLNQSEKKMDSEFLNSYDTFVMGSDQIWDEKLTKGGDRFFWGDFETCLNQKKIVYAASMTPQLPSADFNIDYISLIKKFNSVSVRETELKTLFQPLLSDEISVVVDPTILADKSVWEKLLDKPLMKEKYIVVYQVRSNFKVLEKAREYAKRFNCKIVELVSSPKFNFRSLVYQQAGPIEFLNYIRFAECMFTTSFHGTVFSILFETPFYSFKLNDGHDSRIEEIVQKLGLESRFINVDEDLCDSHFEVNQLLLDELRGASLSYLKNSL